MAEDNFTLTTFYASWKVYQDHIITSIAPPLPSSLHCGQHLIYALSARMPSISSVAGLAGLPSFWVRTVGPTSMRT